MVVVLPYSNEDRQQAIGLLRWIDRLNECLPFGSKHSILLSASHNVSNADAIEVEKVAAKAFTEHSTIRHKWQFPKELFPGTANGKARSTFEYLVSAGTRYCLWLPVQAVPLKKSWLDDIDEVYRSSSRKFLGNEIAIPHPHLSECSVWNTAPEQFQSDIFAHPSLLWWVNTRHLLTVASLTQTIKTIEDASKPVDQLIAEHPGTALVCPSNAVIVPERITAPKGVRVETVVQTQGTCDMDVPVTILLPVRRAKYQHLLECWQSIVDQTHKSWKLVIVDDGENEPRADQLLRSLANNSRVTVVRGSRKGLPSALNLGVSYCSTELIARMDVDDVMLPNRLEVQTKKFASDSRMDVLGAGIQAFGNESWIKTHPENVSLRYILDSQWGMNHPTVMLRKSSLNLVGGYNEKRLASEDFDLWARMAAAGMRLVNLPDVLLKYRLHNDKKCVGENRADTNRGIIGSFRKPMKVGFITRMLCQGGAERWLNDVIRATASHAEWTVCTELDIDESVRRQYAGLCTLSNRIDRTALDQCDVLVSWCQFDPYRFHHPRRRMIISHTGKNGPEDVYKLLRSHAATDPNMAAVGVSNEARQVLVENGFGGARCIRLGVPSNYYTQPIVDRETWRYTNDVSGFLATYVGRFSDEKNLPEIARAFANIDGTLLASGRTWPVGLNGDYVKHLMREGGGHFRSIGWRHDIGETLNASDVFVMASKAESASYTLMEAWLSGTPTICRRVGYADEHPDWLAKWVDLDAGSIERAVKWLQTNPMQRRRLEKIRAGAEREYSWELFSSSWKDFLIDLANR